MQFLVYLTVLMVSVSTVLLEIHWLTTPAPQSKSAVQTSAPPPRPMVEGPSAALSPVYPKKLEPAQPVQPAPTTQNNVQNTVDAATAGNAASKAEPAQKPVAETTGAAPRSDDRGKTQSAVAPDNAQAYAAQPKQAKPEKTATSNNYCDIQACASAYKSFRASDCTYQPFGGERRMCGKTPDQRADRQQRADREQRNEAQRRSWNRREDSEASREVDRRTRWRVYDDVDDDADDGFLFRRSRRW
jgi:hypothetical protein